MFNAWYYLDEGMNSFANFLFYNTRIKSLATHCQSNVTDSEKDNMIYDELEVAITPFERKIIENEVYHKDFIPNNHPILKARDDQELEQARKDFIKETNIDTDEMLWSTEEIIQLHNYKNDMHNAGMERLYYMMNYYHKQHF